MPNSIDWTAAIALVSLVVSVVTLYVAHLRGPNINLAMPGKKTYPCQGLRHGSLHTAADESQARGDILDANLLVANAGNRAGILFSFRLDPRDSRVTDYICAPLPEWELPRVLPPGEGWRTRVSVQIPDNADLYRDDLRSPKALQMDVVYRVSASLGRTREKTTKVYIDLAPLCASRRAT